MLTLHSIELIKYHIISFIPHIIGNLAVPVFFFISGYLFFLNRNTYTFKDYKKKMKRMLFSILIPYILWNFLFALYRGLSFKQLIDPFTYTVGYQWGDNHSILGWQVFTTSPVLFPFWYMKDLIVMELLSPLVWLCLTKYKKKLSLF